MKNIHRYEIPAQHRETEQLHTAVREQAQIVSKKDKSVKESSNFFQLFDFYIGQGKTFLTREDFESAFPKTKDQLRAFLVFDHALNGRLDKDEFTFAVEDIYFSRRTTWFSYTDRAEYVQ